jgi:hypothetical protein
LGLEVDPNDSVAAWQRLPTVCAEPLSSLADLLKKSFGNLSGEYGQANQAFLSIRPLPPE